MTIPEAAQLVLQAGALGKGGDVFVLEMGDPVKIDELARSMIHLSGLEVYEDENPDGDIAIEYTGLRPGEKLYEELLIGDNVTGTAHPKIMRAAEEKYSWDQMLEFRTEFEVAINNFDIDSVKLLLEKVVSGYKAGLDIVDPVWKQSRLIDAYDAGQKNISGRNGKVH